MPPAATTTTVINMERKEKRFTNAALKSNGTNNSSSTPSVNSNGNAAESTATCKNSSNCDLSTVGKNSKMMGANGADLANPMKQTLVSIEHKIRNMEKRKTKLESYKAIQASGKDLSSDQKAAVAKYDSVIATLEFARDFSKQMQQFCRDAEKEQKKQTRKENIAKAIAETNKIREVLVIQNILRCFDDSTVREDFLSGENGALVLEDDEVTAIEKLYNDTRLRRPESLDDAPFVASAQKAAELFSMTIDARPKQFGDVTFEKLRSVLQSIEDSGYLDKIYIVNEQEQHAETAEHENSGNSTSADVTAAAAAGANETAAEANVGDDLITGKSATKEHAQASEERRSSIPYNETLTENVVQLQADITKQNVHLASASESAQSAFTHAQQNQYNNNSAPPNENIGIPVFYPAGPTQSQAHALPNVMPEQAAAAVNQAVLAGSGGGAGGGGGQHKPLCEPPTTNVLRHQPKLQLGHPLFTHVYDHSFYAHAQVAPPVQRLAEVIGEGSFHFLQESEIDPADLMASEPTAAANQLTKPHNHVANQQQQQQTQHADELQVQQQQQQQQQQQPTITTQTFTNQSFPTLQQQQQQQQIQLIGSSVQPQLFQQQLQQQQQPLQTQQAQPTALFSAMNATLAQQTVQPTLQTEQNMQQQQQQQRSQAVVIPISVMPQFLAAAANQPQGGNSNFNVNSQSYEVQLKQEQQQQHQQQQLQYSNVKNLNEALNSVLKASAAASASATEATAGVNQWNNEMETLKNSNSAGIIQNNANDSNVVNCDDDLRNKNEWVSTRDGGFEANNAAAVAASNEGAGGDTSNHWSAAEANTHGGVRRSSGNFQHHRRGNNDDRRDERERERERDRAGRLGLGGVNGGYRARNYGGGGNRNNGIGGSGGGGNGIFFRNNESNTNAAGSSGGGGGGGGSGSNYYQNGASGYAGKDSTRYEPSNGGSGGGGGGGGGYRGARGNQRSNHSNGGANFGRTLPRNSNANAHSGAGSGGGGGSSGSYLNARQSANRIPLNIDNKN